MTRSAKTVRNARFSVPLLAGALLITLSGCSGAITGKWRLEKAIPNREVFSLEDVEFRSDGTYSATFTLDGKTQKQEGAYDFSGFKLTLRPRLGGQRQYNAVRKPGELEIMDGDRKVILEKQ